MERCQSGRMCGSRKAVSRKGPRVRIPPFSPRIFSIGRPECLYFIEVSEMLKSLKVRTFEGFELFCFLANFVVIFYYEY